MALPFRRFVPVSALVLSAALPLLAQPLLPEPPVLTAAQLRRTPFVIKPGTTTINGLTMVSNLYNGMFTPPVFRIAPGESLDLLIDNQMVPPTAANAKGSPGMLRVSEPETRWQLFGVETQARADQIRKRMAMMMHVPAFYTNVHYHGFGVTPLNNSDNVFITILPKTKFQYHVPLPADHPPGLYWYHPHPHEISEPQLLGGMSGAIIVDGIEELRPFLKGMRQRVMLLKDPIFGQTQIFTINGTAGTATIDIRPGERQFWRIGNMGADSYFPLTMGGWPFLVVAIDGNLLETPTSMTRLDLYPGSRYEVVVVGPPAGAKGVLRKEAVTFYRQGTTEYTNPAANLATLVSSGTPVPSAKMAAMVGGATRPDIEEIRRAPISRRCVWTFSEKADFSEYYVNNKVYDVNRIDTQVKMGTYEEWTIVNDSPELHAFHLHQTDFLITKIDGQPVTMNHTNDVVNIPLKSGNTVHSISVKIPFVNPIIAGKFVFHCHVLLHEDRGMMANVVVANQALPNPACR